MGSLVLLISCIFKYVCYSIRSVEPGNVCPEEEEKKPHRQNLLPSLLPEISTEAQPLVGGRLRKAALTETGRHIYLQVNPIEDLYFSPVKKQRAKAWL